MSGQAFEFSVVVSRDGEPVGSGLVSLGPCIEDALFHGVLSGGIPNDGTVPPFEILPRWKNEQDRSIEALALSFEGIPVRSYERRMFEAQARGVITALLVEKRLRKEDLVRWEVIAREPSASPRAGPTVRLRRSPYPLVQRALTHVPPDSFAIEIEASALAEIRRKVVEAGTVECAGLLVGEVFHDSVRRAGALHAGRSVDMKVGHGGASIRHFALDPGSFLSARDELAASGDGEVPVGWYHSHPQCAACEESSKCPASTVFLSTDDITVHMTAFSAPYMVALVAGKVPDLPATQPGFRLYSWQRGLVAEHALHDVESIERPSTNPMSEGTTQL